MSRIKYFFNCIIVVVLLIPVFSVASEKTLKVRVSDYPPFYFKDKSGNWQGVEIDEINALARETGLVVKFVEIPWSRALREMKNGGIDIMMSLSKTPEREKFITFLGISRYQQMSLIVKDNNRDLDIRTIDDLIKYKGKYGIQQDYFYSAEFNKRLRSDKQFADHFEFIVDSTLNLKKTRMGRTLGFFEDKIYTAYKIKTDPSYKQLFVHTFALNKPAPVYIGVSKKTDETIVVKLQKAFKTLEAKGTIKEIVKKWSE